MFKLPYLTMTAIFTTLISGCGSSEVESQPTEPQQKSATSAVKKIYIDPETGKPATPSSEQARQIFKKSESSGPVTLDAKKAENGLIEYTPRTPVTVQIISVED